MKSRSIKTLAAAFFVFTAIPLTHSFAGSRPLLTAEIRLSQGPAKITYSEGAKKSGSGIVSRPLSPSELEKGHQQLVTIIKGISSFSDGVRFPKRIDLKLAALESDPRADMLTNRLYLGLQYARVDDNGRVQTQHPNTMIPVTAHEFGHLLSRACPSGGT